MSDIALSVCTHAEGPVDFDPSTEASPLSREPDRLSCGMSNEYSRSSFTAYTADKPPSSTTSTTSPSTPSSPSSSSSSSSSCSPTHRYRKTCTSPPSNTNEMHPLDTSMTLGMPSSSGKSWAPSSDEASRWPLGKKRSLNPFAPRAFFFPILPRLVCRTSAQTAITSLCTHPRCRTMSALS